MLIMIEAKLLHCEACYVFFPPSQSHECGELLPVIDYYHYFKASEGMNDLYWTLHREWSLDI